MLTNEEDDTLPLQYLNNENPYAFCTDYHKNSINMTAKKEKLSALQRLQPPRLTMKMDPMSLGEERKFLLTHAIENRRKRLIEEGIQIILLENPTAQFDNPEELFEKNIENERILDIAIDIKKMALVSQQMRLRAKVSTLLQTKVAGTRGKQIDCDEKVLVDNLKEAMIFSQLEELSKEEKKE